MFNNWKIGKRLAVAFGISILLMAVVAMAGFWGLSQTVQTTYSILHHDAKLMEQASQAQANGLGLRRYEKDLFLNIGDQQKESDYSDKWNKEHADLIENLNTLDQTVALPEDKEMLRVLRADHQFHLSSAAMSIERLLENQHGEFLESTEMLDDRRNVVIERIDGFRDRDHIARIRAPHIF